jgi:hypothetical protein
MPTPTTLPKHLQHLKDHLKLCSCAKERLVDNQVTKNLILSYYENGKLGKITKNYTYLVCADIRLFFTVDQTVIFTESVLNNPETYTVYDASTDTSLELTKDYIQSLE